MGPEGLPISCRLWSRLLSRIGPERLSISCCCLWSRLLSRMGPEGLSISCRLWSRLLSRMGPEGLSISCCLWSRLLSRMGPEGLRLCSDHAKISLNRSSMVFLTSPSIFCGSMCDMKQDAEHDPVDWYFTHRNFSFFGCL
jgi:hypothetical protein